MMHYPRIGTRNVIISTYALAMQSKAGIVVCLSVCLSVCLRKNWKTARQKLTQFGKYCVMLLSKSDYISVIIDLDLDLES